MDNINSTHLVYPIVFKLCKFKLLTGGRGEKVCQQSLQLCLQTIVSGAIKTFEMAGILF